MGISDWGKKKFQEKGDLLTAQGVEASWGGLSNQIQGGEILRGLIWKGT